MLVSFVPLLLPRNMFQRKHPCLHPQCPSMFKSQHRCTHHIRAMHHNSHKHPVNSIDSDQENQNPNNEVEFNNTLSSHSDSEDLTVDSETRSNNWSPSLPQSTQIEHPHLTGMFTCTGLGTVSATECWPFNPLSALPYNLDGIFLHPGMAPPPWDG